MITLTNAKTLMRDFLKGNEEFPAVELMDFVSDTKLNLHDLIPDSLIKKALDKKFIHAPKAIDKEDKRTALERTMEYRKERLEIANAMEEKSNKVFSLIKANATTKPEVLFRLTWKKGREGIDITAIHPISLSDNMFIGIMLEYSKEFNTLLQINNMKTLYTDNFKFENGTFQVYTNGGDWITAEVENVRESTLMIPEVVKKDKPARPRKLGKEVVVVETKEEGIEEGE